MTGRRRDFEVRRILLALDPAAGPASALSAAAWLASQLDAEIEALFIEDINLLRSAELPFVRRMRRSSAMWEAFDSIAVERELRAIAAEMRRALEAEAERASLRWSYRVVRGHPQREVSEAAREADLVVTASWGAAAPPGAPNSVLIVRDGQAPRQPAAVAYDGSASAERALAAAARLAGGEPLIVLLAGGDETAAKALERQARERLEGAGVAATYLPLAGASLGRLCAAAGEAGSGILVIGAESPLLEDEDAARRLARLGCPVLLAR